MKRLSNLSIQNKLVAIFGAVFVVAVLALAWNTFTIYQNKAQVQTMLNEADELLYLQSIELEFYNVKSIEFDYFWTFDPNDEFELIPEYYTALDMLQLDLDEARRYATHTDTVQLIDRLEIERQEQAQRFEELITLVQKDDFDAADELVWNNDTRRIEQVFIPLDEHILPRWNDLFVTLDDTEQRMDTAIMVSVGTIILFVVIGAVIAVGVLMVSRNIVQPVLTMSVVAESIEKEEFKTEPLVSISVRKDEIGQLSRVFERMAREVFSRVETLKRQVVQLQIVIDREKMDRQVAEITDTEYFQTLQSKVKQLRKQKDGE